MQKTYVFEQNFHEINLRCLAMNILISSILKYSWLHAQKIWAKTSCNCSGATLVVLRSSNRMVILSAMCAHFCVCVKTFIILWQFCPLGVSRIFSFWTNLLWIAELKIFFLLWHICNVNPTFLCLIGLLQCLKYHSCKSIYTTMHARMLLSK